MIFIVTRTECFSYFNRPLAYSIRLRSPSHRQCYDADIDVVSGAECFFGVDSSVCVFLSLCCSPPHAFIFSFFSIYVPNSSLFPLTLFHSYLTLSCILNSTLSKPSDNNLVFHIAVYTVYIYHFPLLLFLLSSERHTHTHKSHVALKASDLTQPAG